MSVERAVWEWLLGCPHLKELYYAASRAERGGAVLTMLSDEETCRFLFGSERQARFALSRFDLLSRSPNDGGNLEAAEALRAVCEWILAQDAEGALPALPERCRATAVSIERIEGLKPEQGGSRLTLMLLLDYFREV